MILVSNFAILDVKRGRQGLLKTVGGHGTKYPRTGNRVPVTITGFIDGSWGKDDGTSREFTVHVTGVETGGIIKDGNKS